MGKGILRSVYNKVINVILIIIESLCFGVCVRNKLLLNNKVVFLLKVFISGVNSVTNNCSIHIFAPDLKVGHLCRRTAVSGKNVKDVLFPVISGEIRHIRIICTNNATGVAAWIRSCVPTLIAFASFVTAWGTVGGEKCSVKNGRLNAPLLPNPPTPEEMIAENRIDPAAVIAVGGPLSENPFCHYTDLSLSEELKLRNAVTTAEGALALLVQNTERVLFGMAVTVVGYGAIGKRLSRLLADLGARVTVAARKEKDRTEAQLQGYAVQDTANLSLLGTEALVNTVPARIFTEQILTTREPSLFFLELASAPYGADPQVLERLKIPYLLGAALPGKVAPITAGEDLAKVIISLLPLSKTKGSGASVGT